MTENILASAFVKPEQQGLICSWLGLPKGFWPPNYYALLDLRLGESDPGRIEVAARERISLLRSRQQSHPDLANEVMDWVRQAHACLTDGQLKTQYDLNLHVNAVPKSSRDTVADCLDTQQLSAPATADADAKIDEKTTQPSNENTAQAGNELQFTPPLLSVDAPAPAIQETPPVESSPAAPESADPLLKSACRSRAARTGIATRRGIYDRIVLTRKLLRIWRRAGRYLNQPRRKLANNLEEKDLKVCLSKVERLLDGFPSFLAGAGQPGYRVGMLAEDENPLVVFSEMSYFERKALAKDWESSLDVLQAHLQHLRNELKKRRETTFLFRHYRLLNHFLDEHRHWIWTALIVAVVGVMAILLAALLW